MREHNFLCVLEAAAGDGKHISSGDTADAATAVSLGGFRLPTDTSQAGNAKQGSTYLSRPRRAGPRARYLLLLQEALTRAR